MTESRDRSEPGESVASPAALTSSGTPSAAPTVPLPAPGTVERLRATARRATAWSLAARETHQSVDVGFRLADRDKRVAAGVLAGGVAYRLFFWLIAVSLLFTGAFGFTQGSWRERMLGTMGILPPASEIILDLARAAQPNRWWVLVVGTWLLLWTGYLGGKALVLVHAAVWGIPAPPPPRSWVLSLTFSGTAFALFTSMSVTAWLHSSSQALAVLTALASTALPGAIWLAISRLPPHRVAMWRGLVPGAVLVAVGIQAFTIVTIWFLASKLASATALYGILGVAATFLFWLYILGRLFIAAATLNASLHEQRTASAGIWGPR